MTLSYYQITNTSLYKNHSIIAEYTNINPYRFSVHEDGVNLTNDTVKTYGIFQKYPTGIINPAFTGMFLWELSSSHALNDYNICQFHSTKSGIILYGTKAFVFTPINNLNFLLVRSDTTLKNHYSAHSFYIEKKT